MKIHPLVSELAESFLWFLQLAATEWKRAFLCLCISSFLVILSLLFTLEEKMAELVGLVVVMTIPLVIASHIIDILLQKGLKPELPNAEAISEQAN